MRSRSVNLRQTIWLVVELQELVLSKVTFYVNPNWDLLERPIDDLGQYYNLCPFIDLYTRNQEHATSKENISIAMAALPAQDVQDLLNGKRQQERTGMVSLSPSKCLLEISYGFIDRNRRYFRVNHRYSGSF